MDVARIVRTHVASSELDPPQDLVASINAGSTQLLEVVKGLGEYLTSTEEEVRLKGLIFLVNVIKTIDPTRINGPASRTLCSFFLSKLDDFDSLPPTLSALIVLSKQPSFDDETALDIYRGIVETVNMKSYVQATRHLVYTLFDSLLASHRQAFKNMGSEFINSYTKMVDGEKDPRNLMLLFSIDRVILLEFEVQSHIEEMFDITFCYFPISFRPPPNDPYGITADDLKASLRACMSASPFFAKLALPLFLEKFATVSGPTMNDLLLSMAACFPVYGAEAVGERGAELWEAIKTEIFYSSDTAIEAASLSALEALVRTIYPTAANVPSGLAQDIIKECLETLNDPEKSQAVGATKALAAIVRASPSAGPFALSQALPQLFQQFNRPTLPSHRAPILTSITSLLIAARSVYAAPQATRTQAKERSLELHRIALMDVLREGLRTEGLKIPATNGCVALVEIPNFWGQIDLEEVLKSMNELLIGDEDEEVKSAVISGISTISNIQPNAVQSIILPVLFHALPDSAPSRSSFDDRDQYRDILNSLSSICPNPTLFETLVIRIMTKLDFLSSTFSSLTTPTSFSSSSGIADSPMTGQTETEIEMERREVNVAYAWDLISCLKKVVEEKIEKKHVDVNKYFDKIVPFLLGLVISAAQPRADRVVPLFRDRRLIMAVSGLFERLIWEQSQEKQNKVFEALYAAFETGDFAGLVTGSSSSTPITSIGSPLRPRATAPEQDLIALYSSGVQGLKSGFEIPSSSSSVNELLGNKVYWIIRVARDEYQVGSALDLITAFVNKQESALKDNLEVLLESIWMKDCQDTTQPLSIRQRGLLVYFHIIKAIALLRLPLAYTSLEKAIDILSLSDFDPLFVDQASKAFGILASGKNNLKGKGKAILGGHLTAKLLHAQKLWNFVLPKLIEGDKEAQGKGRMPYIQAFASLLPLVPSSLLLADLKTILPLLLRSLSLRNARQRGNAIVAIHSVLEMANGSTEIDVLLHSYAEELVDGILKSCTLQQGVESTPATRASALECLAVFPDSIRYESLRSYKPKVIKELGLSVDDPVRKVRREAVDCRARWYRYGAGV